MKWIKKVATTPLEAIAKVVDTLQSQTNDRTNAPSIHAVNEALSAKWADIYPIGSIYMSVTDVDPSTIFGGTWEQIKDKFLLASGDTYAQGTTGGQANISYTPSGTTGDHKIALDEMPAHDHQLNPLDVKAFAIDEGSGISLGKSILTNDYLKVTVDEQAGIEVIGSGIYEVASLGVNGWTQSAGKSSSQQETHNHTFTGTQATLATMPPYLVVNVWVRTA